ncbi:MAG: hypothetical protein AAF443_07305, partial [Chlamydiota bacterium]
GYFDRLFSWVLIRQVDKTQGKIGQKGPPNALRFLHFESAWVYSASGLKARILLGMEFCKSLCSMELSIDVYKIRGIDTFSL